MYNSDQFEQCLDSPYVALVSVSQVYVLRLDGYLPVVLGYGLKHLG